MQHIIHEHHAHYLSITKAIRYLNDHYIDQPSLAELASLMGMSESHFQRIFTEWAGVSPKQFLQYITKEHAKKKLRENSVLVSALNSGLSGSSRLHDLLVTHESITPGEYKTWGQGVSIYYGVYSCLFGFCFIAVTARGLCKLSFFDKIDEKDTLIRELQAEWACASIKVSEAHTTPYFEQLFIDESHTRKPIHLLLKGTPFKLQVWHALLSIPRGQLSTYSDVAQSMNKPNAVRAVATAIASNSIAYLIPCHRVIRNTGVLNNYRWGAERKVAMIAKEQSFNQESCT